MDNITLQMLLKLDNNEVYDRQYKQTAIVNSILEINEEENCALVNCSFHTDNICWRDILSIDDFTLIGDSFTSFRLKYFPLEI